MVDDIRNFLQKDEHTNPANILDIAQQVLNLQMPPQSEIDELKAKMAQLGMDPSTDDNEDDTGANFAELNRIQIEASDVLNRARELAKKVDRYLVSLFLLQYLTSFILVHSSITETPRATVTWLKNSTPKLNKTLILEMNCTVKLSRVLRNSKR